MAIRNLIAFAALAACLTSPAWAGSFQFHGNDFAGQGTLTFTPGMGNTLSIGAGNGGTGALITDFFSPNGICGGDCPIIGGYMTLTTGGTTGSFVAGGAFGYMFAPGGTITITGEIPLLGINTPTALLTASLTNATFAGSGSVGSFVAGINLASITLAAQLGTYKYSGAGNDEISFNLSPSCSAGGVCSGTLIQSDSTFQTVPEPATLSILDVGLFTTGAGLRRRSYGKQS